MRSRPPRRTATIRKVNVGRPLECEFADSISLRLALRSALDAALDRYGPYGVVQAELETFLARAQARERPVPRFVERELRGFLRCRILAHGFVRVHCDACGLDRVVAFSCKGRSFCPS